MILRTLPLLAALLLSACASTGAPGCTGPVRQLNIGKWTTAPNDLAVPATTARSS